ncbi:MAG: type II toxin-antitoxin system RelE/ParE family toxin [Candidatus Delongbacteria bacterium]|nr:type II toxin-antitoxin system RelE/ParE family toxin [Candidatus Delongbacteria bacterium]
MKIVFLPPAFKELEDAINYYNFQLENLGDQFYQEFLEASLLIRNFPSIWHKTGKYSRRFVLRRFPYMILFVAESDKIIITAVAHQHRHPESYNRSL